MVIKKILLLALASFIGLGSPALQGMQQQQQQPSATAAVKDGIAAAQIVSSDMLAVGLGKIVKYCLYLGLAACVLGVSISAYNSYQANSTVSASDLSSGIRRAGGWGSAVWEGVFGTEKNCQTRIEAATNTTRADATTSCDARVKTVTEQATEKYKDLCNVRITPEAYDAQCRTTQTDPKTGNTSEVSTAILDATTRGLRSAKKYDKLTAAVLAMCKNNSATAIETCKSSCTTSGWSGTSFDEKCHTQCVNKAASNAIPSCLYGYGTDKAQQELNSQTGFVGLCESVKTYTTPNHFVSSTQEAWELDGATVWHKAFCPSKK